MLKTKTLSAELLKKKASEKHIGVFPLEFDEGGENESEGESAIPTTIHLIPVGQWEHDLYGPILINASDIREFVQNFNMGIRKGVPITAGHEGFAELPAEGWVTKVEARDDGLWGDVEWNDSGIEKLEDKQFKFFSPEFYRDYEDPQTHQIYRNVLVGGALTKSPYFKELEAIVFSEPKFKNKFNDNAMLKIEDIVSKKVEDLNDDEKAFLKEHKAELSEEQKTAFTAVIDEPSDTDTTETDEEKTAREAKEKEDADAAAAAKATEDANVAAGLNPDGSAKVDASEKVLVGASELAILRRKADEGAQAFAEMEKRKLDDSVKSLMFSETNKTGKFMPKSTDSLRTFMQSLDAGQRQKFADLVKEIPASQAFKEVGDGGAADGTSYAEVEAKIATKREMAEKAGKPMTYSIALKEVMAENAGLEERYDRELPSARKVQA